MKYVAYDNACALAHFARHGRRPASSSIAKVIADLVFVLDRFHEKNHTTCLDLSHPLYTPQVDPDVHDDLKFVNTSMNEIFNAWLIRFGYITSSMHPDTWRVFLLLAALFWNTRVVPRDLSRTDVVPVVMQGGQLKRYRYKPAARPSMKASASGQASR